MDLPPLKPFEGSWQDYEDALYQHFLDTVVNAGLLFKGWPVYTKKTPATKGKHFSFWHLISEGKEEEERTPDLRRCERLGWVGWVVGQAEKNPAVSWWENRRGTNTHVVLWLEAHDFVVVLAKRKDYFVIKTAYMVDRSRQIATFRKERDQFWRSKKG